MDFLSDNRRMDKPMSGIYGEPPKHTTFFQDAIEFIPEKLRLAKMFKDHYCICYVDNILFNFCVFEATSIGLCKNISKFNMTVRFYADKPPGRLSQRCLQGGITIKSITAPDIQQCYVAIPLGEPLYVSQDHVSENGRTPFTIFIALEKR